MYCLECYSENPEGSLFCESCGCPFEVKSKKEEKKLLKDRYKIISALSAGGVGGVSLGYDVRLNRACAIKGIYKKGLADLPPEEKEAIIKPFKREAELLANLRHPNLPCVTDYFIENDMCYLVMDYIEGKDLEIIIEEEGGKPLVEKQVMEWAIQICRVLEYLHNQKPPIIHGDLKLANLIIRDSDGWIMLVDFGTASLETIGSDVEQPYGTDGYAPPEQYLGAQEIRSDIYSLGVTMYELLTLTLPEEPFKFTPLRELTPEVSADMERIVMKCLAYDMEERFENATILKQNLLAAHKRNFGMTRSRYRTGKLIAKSRKITDTTLQAESDNIKVFVVDNDIDMCNSFKEIAKFFKNIQVTGDACNGKDAIEKIRQTKDKPDVILMEIRMPVMDGIEATKKIREILPFAKIIILSAFLEEEEFLACFEAGASGYILKGDTSWEELEKSIKKAYDGGTPISSDASTLLIKALTCQKISAGQPLKIEENISRKSESIDEEMKLCPSCNNLNRPRAKYCKGCGANIDKLLSEEEESPDYEEEEVVEEIVVVEESEEEGEDEIVEEIILFEEEISGDTEDIEEKVSGDTEHIEEEKEALREELSEIPEIEEEDILITHLASDEEIMNDAGNETIIESNILRDMREISDDLSHKEKTEEELDLELDENNKNKLKEFQRLGRKYFLDGDLDSALIYYKEALKFKPEDPNINYELAGIYHLKEYLDEALEHYEVAVREKPDIIEAQTAMGQIYLEKNDLEKALFHCNRALEFDPKHSDAYLNLGYIKCKQGELNTALHYFAYVIELIGDNLEAHLGLGNVYQIQNDFDNAISCYETALEMNDRCVEAYSNLGIIYTKQGEFKKALGYIKQAMTISFEVTLTEVYDDLIEKIREGNEKWESPYGKEIVQNLLVNMVNKKENSPLLRKIIDSHENNLEELRKKEEIEGISENGELLNICSNCTTPNRSTAKYCRNCGEDFMVQEEIVEEVVNEVIQLILEEDEEKIFNEKAVKISELIKAAEDMTRGLSIIKYISEKKDDEGEEVYTLCPNCETLNKYGALSCRECGVEFEYEDMEIIEDFTQDLPLVPDTVREGLEIDLENLHQKEEKEIKNKETYEKDKKKKKKKKKKRRKR